MQTLEMRLAEKHIKDALEEIQEKARGLEGHRKELSAKETNLKHKKGELEKIIAETEKEENELRAISASAREKVDTRQSEVGQRKKVLVCENCGRILVDEELVNPKP